MAEREKRKKGSLSLRQERFLQAYLSGHTPEDAYRLAGYRGKDARKSGAAILHSQGIQREIKRLNRQTKTYKRPDVSDIKTRTLEEIAAMAFADLGDYLQYHTQNKDGKEQVVFSYRDSEQVDTRNLASVTVSGNQLKISLYDKQKALFKLFDRFYLRGEDVKEDPSKEILDALLQAAKEGFSKEDEKDFILEKADPGDELVDGSQEKETI